MNNNQPHIVYPNFPQEDFVNASNVPIPPMWNEQSSQQPQPPQPPQQQNNSWSQQNNSEKLNYMSERIERVIVQNAELKQLCVRSEQKISSIHKSYVGLTLTSWILLGIFWFM